MENFEYVVSYVKNDEDKFWECSDYLKENFDKKNYLCLLHDALRRVAQGKDLKTHIAANGRYITLAVSKNIILALAIYKNNISDISISPNHFMQLNITNKNSRSICTKYRASESYSKIFVSDVIDYGFGDMVSKNGYTEAIDIRSIDHNPVIALRLNYGPLPGLEYNFDRKTLKQTRMLSGSVVDSKIHVFLQTIAEVGSEDSIDLVIPFLNHEHGYIRWEAIKTISILNFEESIKYIEMATMDRDPNIIMAAKKALNSSRVINHVYKRL
ncbi:HEAT repeat domain-containing protein [Neokomagataea thailandica]